MWSATKYFISDVCDQSFNTSSSYGSFQLSLDKSRLAQFEIWNIVFNNQNKQVAKVHITVHVHSFLKLKNEPTYTKLQTTKFNLY